MWMFRDSAGYLSLRAAYLNDVRKKRTGRSKQELLKKFLWVLARAKHYASKQNTFVDIILNQWEEKRTYWWLNFYQDSNMPKLGTGRKRMGPRGIRKHQDQWHDKAQGHRIRFRNLMYEQKQASKKTKSRWSMDRKERGY